MFEPPQSPPPTSADLLQRAAEVQSAATAGDTVRLQREAGVLLDDFLDHMALRRHALHTLSPFAAELVTRGQERVLAHLMALTMEAVGLDPVTPVEVLAERAAVVLADQLDAEARAFGQP
jgi:hypothetical protein